MRSHAHTRVFARDQERSRPLAAVLWFCTVVALTMTATGAADAQECPDTVVVRAVQAIQEHLYNDRYAAAERAGAGLIATYPDRPEGYLFKAVTLVTAMYDAEDDARRDEYRALLDTAEARATNSLRAATGRTRAWAFLMLGHVESYRALYEAKFGSKIGAARTARTGAAHYRRGLACDSTLTDLYFGLGLYHYWKSAKAGLLRWIGLVANDRDKGIAQLEAAAAGSVVSSEAARSSLVWVLLDRKEYDRVIALTHDMMARYPESHTYLWPLAEAYAGAGRTAEAAQAYKRLRAHYATHPGNYLNLIECDYRLAKCYDALGLGSAMAEAAEEASAYFGTLSARTQESQRERIEYLQAAAD